MSPLCLYELDQLVKWPAVPGHVTLSPDMWASRSEGPASFAASSAGITPFLASIVALFFPLLLFLCSLLSLSCLPPAASLTRNHDTTHHNWRKTAPQH